MKPSELSREVEIRAAAVEASDTRVTVDEPVQSWVQRSWVEDRGGTKEGQMPKELGEGIRNEERIGECGTAQRSRRKRIGLNDGGGDWEQMGMRVEGKRNGTKLRGDREPSDGTVRKEEMTAGASGGRGSEARVGGW
jgi:hypothetical protein